MKKRISKFINWCKIHSKEIVLGIVGIVGVAIISVLCNKKFFDNTDSVLSEKMENPFLHDETIVSGTEIPQRKITSPYEVKRHIRKLPVGQHPSQEKRKTAIENGYQLNEGETWVVQHTRGKSA